MQKELLAEMLVQNQFTNSFAFEKITNENLHKRLNEQAASVGFIYRHIGETMNLFGYFFGIPSEVPNTTMGQQDIGQDFDLETSQTYVAKGYEMLKKLVEETTDEDWLTEIDTPFFGKVSKIRLFSHVLFHNSHHGGQISLTLSKG
ncbi:hypothetical protein GCM10011514_44340 [Emticicia aquatilis]|uniref:DinB-like domain-containing protein n=1 Tax=Emticicia aquatilis TaxID=1537369 RepID=A0A916Z5G7_9BACT|nr:DinB family protein [Emticicia aquatilis]GGD75549.1 hypothetical protein GCM10011514_44340 [Emticicia aquatilis]